MTLYRPGQTVNRFYSNYNARQEALWEAFDDFCYAWLGGYGETRQPAPWQTFDSNAFKAWQQKALNQWAIEAKRDDLTRGPDREDIPEHLWLYLYERMLAAPKLASYTHD